MRPQQGFYVPIELGKIVAALVFAATMVYKQGKQDERAENLGRRVKVIEDWRESMTYIKPADYDYSSHKKRKTDETD